MSSFKFKVLLPIFLLTVVEIIFISFFSISMTEKQIEKQALSQALLKANDYKILRQYYTKNVIEVVQKHSSLDMGVNHHSQDEMIPLPATMIHDLSRLSSQVSKDVKVKLYSQYPFPKRQNRILDAFAKSAIKHFNNENSKPYIKRELIDEKPVVRVAIADIMTASSCVKCHNTHAQTPKDDWKLYDVRGVLEVDLFIQDQLASASELRDYVNYSIVISIIIVAILVSLLVMYYNRNEKKYLLSIQTERNNAINSEKDKDQFFANMSHSLRTPLNSIVGFSQYLREHNKDSDAEFHIEQIQNNSTYLLHMVNEVLDLSSMAEGKLQIQSQPFKVLEQIELLCDEFKGKLQEKNLSLQYNHENLSDTCLEGDWIRITEVIHHLMDNAIKFSPENEEILFIITYEYGSLVLKVQDSGPGIPLENQALLFSLSSKQRRLQHFTTIGFGLLNCKAIIDAMGGMIECISTEGQGSLFVVHLALKQIDCKTLTSKEPTKIDVEKFNAHVLIAEDNKTNQLLLELLLKDKNITVDIAEDGLQAVEMYNPNKHALILMDEDMPRMTGLEALVEIREKFPDAIIIAVTANVMQGDKERFLNAGMNDYISKPIDAKYLMKILSKYIS